MVQPIKGYLSSDGLFHHSAEEAEFHEYRVGLTADIRDFIAEHKIDDRSGAIAGAISKWDLWRLGGYAGWLVERQKDPGTPVPAAPRAEQPVTAEAKPVVVTAATPPVPAAPAPRPAAPIDTIDTKPPVDAKPPFRRRVAVVALANMHHREIDRAFGDEFKLTLLDAHGAMDRLESLRAYHKVIVMTRQAHPKAIEVLRRIGQEPLLVHGAVPELKEALTDLYLADVH